ncbi:hypothetical protein MJ904_05325 [Massilia sp. MB5]|uniref:hypothetical protein n=1 Tax=Massilia sp. MB5 TaxID=2919578 RepID=UPI001F0CE380|nr:hypothetical protein [Massilia sp. MB5]UMR31637.1 hypothetical protein MJ904_05325 [Massilia sp. MB5]
MDFFTPLSSGQLGKMDAVQSQHLSKIQGRATTKEVTLIRLNAAAFQASSLRMAMPGSKPLTSTRPSWKPAAPPRPPGTASCPAFPARRSWLSMKAM